MPARFHSLVQDANDLHQVGRGRSIVENMHRPPHLGHRRVADVTDMKAAHPGKKIGASARRRAVRVAGDLANGRGKEPCIAPPPLRSPPFRAGHKNMRKVGFRQEREA